jgi:hypothetical protein
MISLLRTVVIVTGATALSACGGSKDTAGDRKAENSRILEGSISDEMIAYEKLRSEPPAAQIDEGESKGGNSAGEGPGAKAAGASDNSAAAAPVAPDAPAEAPAEQPVDQ